MCPGGEVVAAASEPDGVVTNGMSRFARDGRNANSALLVSVRPGGLRRRPSRWPAWSSSGAGSGGLRPRRGRARGARCSGSATSSPAAPRSGSAPCCRPTAPACRPGRPRALPAGLRGAALRAALPALERKLRGFADPDALLTGVETRTSSPVRVLRDEGGEAACGGLYPAGEGAGYAGGIVSAAVDGLRAAECHHPPLRALPVSPGRAEGALPPRAVLALASLVRRARARVAHDPALPGRKIRSRSTPGSWFTETARLSAPIVLASLDAFTNSGAD